MVGKIPPVLYPHIAPESRKRLIAVRSVRRAVTAIRTAGRSQHIAKTAEQSVCSAAHAAVRFSFLHLVKCFYIRLEHKIIPAAFFLAIMLEKSIAQ